MLPYEFYKVLHFAGMFLMLMALGGIAIHRVNGGTRENFPTRKWAGMLHGIGLFFILLAGFGLYARRFQGLPFPPWIYAKLVIWLLLGAAPVVLYKAKSKLKLVFLAVAALAILAAYFATYKPFHAIAMESASPESSPTEAQTDSQSNTPSDDPNQVPVENAAESPTEATVKE